MTTRAGHNEPLKPDAIKVEPRHAFVCTAIKSEVLGRLCVL